MIPKGVSKNIVIYGLDADLIILSMTIKNNRILLLRESENINVNDMNFISSDGTSKSL